MDNGLEPVIITSEVPKKMVDRSMLNILNDLTLYKYCFPEVNKVIDDLRSKLGAPVVRSVTAGIESRMYELSEKAIKDYKISLIYSISSVGDAHNVAMKLAEKYGIPWVAEFQDPWLENQTLMSWSNEYMNGIYRFFWKKKIEATLKKIIEKADLIVAETKGHCQAMRQRARNWSFDERKIIYAYLGSDQRVIDKIGEPLSDKLIDSGAIPIIGFVGGVYYGYEERARNFIRCLRQLELEGVSFCLLTVGCDLLPQLAVDEGLNSILPISRVPFREAIGIMKIMNIGVTIPSSDININSKLFDYLQQGCPVLVWGCYYGEMASIVKKFNCGIAIDDLNYNKSKVELKEFIAKVKQHNKLFSLNNNWHSRGKLFELVARKTIELYNKDEN